MSELSPIEYAVVRALANGLQSKEIAVALGRSRATIEFHVRALYDKLDARSRAHIVARAFESNILAERDVRQHASDDMPSSFDMR
jgi:DNA-binding NarL/FixJ family response regulator